MSSSLLGFCIYFLPSNILARNVGDDAKSRSKIYIAVSSLFCWSSNSFLWLFSFNQIDERVPQYLTCNNAFKIS